jgi:Trypsin-like peptidase domain
VTADAGVAAPPSATAEQIAALIPAEITISDIERAYRPLMEKAMADQARGGRRQIIDDWPVIALPGDDEAIKIAACRAAESGGFLGGLAEQLAHIAIAFSRDPAATKRRIDKLLAAARGKYAYMEAVEANARAFLSAELFLKLPSIVRATALVKEDALAVGTAFLVGPDLVLTSEHVVVDPQTAELKKRITFVFSERSGSKPVVRLFQPRSDKPIIASSPRYGTFPLTDWTLTASADARLDYALVRLSARVTGIDPIELSDLVQADNPNNVFIFGYRGGSDLAADASSEGITVKQPGRRFVHKLRTVPGMSGSPCVGPLGTAIGLHEAGRLSDAKAENRAVDLKHVFDDIVRRLKNKNPLAPLNSSTDYGIYNSALRRAWAKRGQALAGAELEAWRAAVESLGDPAPSSDGPVRAFHPLLDSGSQLLVEWARKVLEKRSRTRVAAVTPKGRGVGASFAIDRLVASLDDSSRLVRYDLGLSKEPRELLGVAAAPDPLRPLEGWTRHDLVAEAMRRIADDRPVFVVIDFGSTSLAALALDMWAAFVAELVARSGINLVLVNPPTALELSGMTGPNGVQFDPATELQRVEIDVPDDGKVMDCLFELARASGKRPPTQNDLAAAKTDWTAVAGSLSSPPPQLAAVYAVWLVLRVMNRLGMVEG